MSASKARKEKKPPKNPPANVDSPLARMRDRFAARDVRSARRFAFALVKSDELTEAQKKEARRLLEQTEIDQQAMWIGAFALLLALIYIGAFIL